MLPGYDGCLIGAQFLDQTVRLSQSSSAGGVFTRGEGTALRRSQQALGPASSLRAMLETVAEPLVRLLGFSEPSRVTVSPGILAATICAGSHPVVLVVVPWGERLDTYWRPSMVEARSRRAGWSVLFNGTQVRLLDAAHPHQRRYAQFDLEFVFDDQRAAEGFLSLLSAGALARSGSAGSSAVDLLIEASDKHGAEVCRSLRAGVLEASEHVVGALMARRSAPSLDDAFEQALTVVYRILFLLFAEARRLVPLWHPVYRDSYTIEGLSNRALARASHGLWDGIRAISRLAQAGCRAGDLRVSPFNGRLFAPIWTPLVERRDLDDEAARRAVIALSTRPASRGGGRERIAYGDLGVEQLGAVYETVLDYRPTVESAAGARRRSVRISLRPGSGVRKSTSTFYTPQAIARYVIRRTLEPLVREASPEQILEIRVLDPAMGSGAFLVGACTFLAEAYEAALVRTGRCHGSDLGSHERAMIRRTVAERCLFGVDLNPMAVQVARLSLWLAALAADRPLGFLDHHLRVGNSLLGTWLACLRRSPSRQNRRPGTPLPLFDEGAVVDALREALPVRFNLALGPDDTVEQIHAKERALAALDAPASPVSTWKRIADLWCARWFARDEARVQSLYGALVDRLLGAHGLLPSSVEATCLAESADLAAARRFFHWELEFPEVFFEPDGTRRRSPGFDAVLGNPPWDMMREDPGARRADRQWFAPLVRFTREAGVYTEQSDGHANSYQLFFERAVALTRPGGRIGLVLPSGFATDHGSAPLRRLLFSRCAADAMVGFVNQRRIFPVHRSVRFLLLTASRGTPTTSMACRFGEADPGVLPTESGDGASDSSWFPIRLSPALIEKLSGDDLTIPDVRSPADLAILERAATLFRPLGDKAGWHVRFGRELNATDDRAELRERGEGMPVLGGRQIEPFTTRLERPPYRIAPRDAARLLGNRHLRARLAYRDVASSTNRQTLIAAVLPAGSVSTHTLFCLKTPLASRLQWLLCGLFNSFVVNFLARLHVVTHVTTRIVERLPVPTADEIGPSSSRIAAAARRLSRGIREPLLAWLNAMVAVRYQLTESEFAHVLATFPLVPRAERDAALRAFRRAQGLV
jgi:hypothetical protein